MERRRGKFTVKLISSYVLDWIILIGTGIVAAVWSQISPNKRPFQLEDPNISFPYTEHETVSSLNLSLASVVGPIVLVAAIALVFVPGSTVPPGTPKSLIWKRKLWELHMGWLGLALALCCQFIIVSGMKNLFGKPRPDLLSRCKPDLDNVARYVVGGIANITSNGQLVSAAICTQQDSKILNDGFRSYPSGHSSTSAAGLIYLSLFIASKFAITIPFLAPAGYSDAGSFSAFPSRSAALHRPSNPAGAGADEAYELVDHHHPSASLPPSHRSSAGKETLASPGDPLAAKRLAAHRATVAAVRLQAAAPPLYLLAVCIVPFFASIFIASSRWFDFRHHGFDILFGYLIGVTTAFFGFRYYHLPIRQGAGWAWGPRSHDKAFWGGVGSYSYATARGRYLRAGDEEEALPPPLPLPRHHGGPDGPGLESVRVDTGRSTGGGPLGLPRGRTPTDRTGQSGSGAGEEEGKPPRRLEI